MNAAVDFYRALSTVSFSLLGLWFIVLGLDRRWRDDPVRHRTTLHTALCFFLPGMMGLGSVLGGGSTMLWRAFFVLGGTVGLIESLLYLRFRRRAPGPVWGTVVLAGPWAYFLVIVAAVLPFPLGELAPQQVEGLATGLVFCLGMGHLWIRIAEPEASATVRTGTASTR